MNWLINLFKSIFKTAASNPIIPQLLVQDACGRTFTSKPGLAAKALQITSTAIAMIQNKEIGTMTGLNDFVNKQIAGASLTPEETALVQILIGSVQSQIATPTSITSPVQNLTQAVTVLQWVHDSSAIYAAKK